MADILGELELFKKPVPAKRQKVDITIPLERESVDVGIPLEDRRDEDFDRTEIMEKIRRVRIAHIPQIKTAKPSSDIVASPSVSEEAPLLVRKVVKKRGKIRLGKKLLKGTITAITVPPVEESKKIKVSVKRRAKVKVRTRSDVPPERIQIGDTLAIERLWPNVPQVNLRASAYYMNNRKIFINFINTLFEPYRRALEEEKQDVSCDRGDRAFSLMTHQAIIRDYINLYSPYRGLLIYHGLGAGKTCASISIAEGIKTEKQIVIMTPASLRQNYISELKMCGDPLYRLNQFWEFINTNGDTELENQLAKILHLQPGFINSAGGAWLVNMKKPANYSSLTTPEKMTLNRQINAMISAKYYFLNYNGLRSSHLPTLTGGDEGTNPFDNKVIIIDEAHNFVSRIVNKISKKTSLSYKLYHYLMAATGCKIIFLTGTPIINYPNEIGIMFNMLRGFIKTFTFYVNVQTDRRIDQKAVTQMFSSMVTSDYIKYDAASKTVVVTRNPFGFVSVNRGELYEGVKRNKGGNKCDPKNRGRDCARGFICGDKGNCIPMTDEVFVQKCMALLRNNELEPMRNPKVEYFRALPDTLENFNAMFINPKTGDIRNKGVFQKRILGLTSYFRSAQEQLMPAFNIEEDLKIVDIPMSDYQFGIYENARAGERDMEKRNARRKKVQQGADGIYADSVSTYRIFSRAFCNFVFPREILRPKPQEAQDLKSTIGQQGIDENDLDAVSLQERLAEVGIYNKSDEGALQELVQETSDSSYGSRIKQALIALKTGAKEFLSPKALSIYSPKFLNILTNIMDEDNIGLHLVYSQFRTLEGIGIFSLVLQENGFARFTINKNDSGVWEVTTPVEDRGKPMFALYTGTEDSDEKEIMRNIYNGTWDKIPSSLREYVTEIAENNNHGEIIKVFMITSSGAEGITLKNTRYVHIMEPYWHPVRVEQVIGRARRICSHNELPESERNVKVFIYLMKFADNQLISTESGGLASRDLLNKDVSKIDRKTPLTSDQALWEISNIKEDINKQILRAIKSSAIDCTLHNDSTEKDPIVCMSFGKPAPGEFTTTPSYSTTVDDTTEKKNKKLVKFKAETVKLDGIRYALNRFNKKLPARKAPEGELYDYESYIRALRTNEGEPMFVGYLRIDVKTGKLKKSTS